jgi:hypothetical protein
VIAETLLEKKADILSDTMEGLFKSIQNLEREIVLKVIPVIEQLETDGDKLIPTADNYAKANVSQLVRAEISGEAHVKFTRSVIANLNKSRELALEASRKMDKDFKEAPHTQLIIEEGGKAIVRNLSPDVLGVFISTAITNRIILGISISESIPDLVESLINA